MQFLTALLAFAAVMALMSTIVAVIIEAVINLFGMRSAGLKRLLETYYREAVAPRLPPGANQRNIGADARRFADEVVANPARRPGFARFGPRQLNSLTTRQLIEHTARSSNGGKLLDLSDDDLRPRLEALAYEFDRLSEGARDFFTRRTRGVSVLIAFVLAFSLNIDAVRLYRALAVDREMSERVISYFEQIQESDPNAPGNASAAASTPDDSREQITRQLELLSTLTIPIGVSQFPYCSPYSPLLGRVESNSVVFDQRCAEIDQDQRLFAPPPPDQVLPINGAWFSERMAWSRLGDWTIWFISVLVAGGMIGLGAPFWFNVYRRLGMLVPAIGAAAALAGRFRGSTSQDRPTPSDSTNTRRRVDEEVRGGDSLVIAARTAAGQSPDVHDALPGEGGPNITGHSPPGASIGAGSAQRVAAAAPASGEGSVRIRRLRG